MPDTNEEEICLYDSALKRAICLATHASNEKRILCPECKDNCCVVVGDISHYEGITFRCQKCGAKFRL
ncbi:MAG: hypothetical protein ACE5K4_01010 [Candidatus Hydrothermarchaeota archaeon]